MIQPKFRGYEPHYLHAKRLYQGNPTNKLGWVARLATQKNVKNPSHKWDVSWSRMVLNIEKTLAQRMATEVDWAIDVPSLFMLKHRAKTEHELVARTNLSFPNPHIDRLPLFPHYANQHLIPLDRKWGGSDDWPVKYNYCRNRAIANCTHNRWLKTYMKLAWEWVQISEVKRVLPNLPRLTDISPKSYRRGKCLQMCLQLTKKPDATRDWFMEMTNTKFRWSSKHMTSVYNAWRSQNMLSFMSDFFSVDENYQPKREKKGKKNKNERRGGGEPVRQYSHNPLQLLPEVD